MPWSSLLVVSISFVYVVSASISLLGARDTNSTSPSINFTITDHNGLDVTSAFKIMLYEQPQIRATDNLNDRQVGLVRPINTCNDREGIFVNSTCNHKDQVQGSLKAYTYHCLAYIPDRRNSGYSQRIFLAFYGECHEDEICVNGRGKDELSNEPTDVAHCVKAIGYTELTGATTIRQLNKALADLSMDATLSGKDQKTPFKADSIEVEAGVSAFSGAKGTTQRKSCVDCLELTTDKLAPKTDFLETEVKLLATGVVAGILWLTMLSG